MGIIFLGDENGSESESEKIDVFLFFLLNLLLGGPVTAVGKSAEWTDCLNLENC